MLFKLVFISYCYRESRLKHSVVVRRYVRIG